MSLKKGERMNRGFALLALLATTLMVLVLGAAQAFATHVSCGDTITQDTALDNDLIDCPGNGIVIGANDITLDLNGHTIAGNGTTSKEANLPPWSLVAGVLFGGSDASVTNGTIRGFRVGVLSGSFHSRIQDDRLVDNVEGIRVSEPGDTMTVSGNLITETASFGIFVDDSSFNEIYGNRVLRADTGILVADGSADNRLASNRVRRNVDDGIRVEEPYNTTLTGNRADFNGDFGIEAALGNIDGGGNRAKHNGNPLQCLNVVCR
jgi:parallel beta-helix repeat protein